MLKIIKTSTLVLTLSVVTFLGFTNEASAAKQPSSSSVSIGSFSLNSFGSWNSSVCTATRTTMTLSIKVTNAGGKAWVQKKSEGKWKYMENSPTLLVDEKTYSEKFTSKVGTDYRVHITPMLGKTTGKVTCK
ncbi:hypothetical protein OJ967_03620 [Peribacillus frigoritolerans]|uniref:hypothetical protein n=1 Tax=Peribacillus frigoritolerans TaxID=450367 RepID=UPI0022275DFE|nr:hypothetical protein [Peribacillus frigoritolerans]UYY99652.1 hypothetical protein OJ967_03620 [Peribacillus frigoritolerans]